MKVLRSQLLLVIFVNGTAGVASAETPLLAETVASIPTIGDVESATPTRWYQDAERGWFWYEEPPADLPLEDVEKVMPPVAVNPADPIAELENLQAAIEQAKARAVLHPTEDNIRAWMALNAAVQRRATLFADVTQRVVWSTPALDQSLVRPHSQAGLKAWTAARTESRARALAKIAQTHGLLFLFESDCPYCIEMAPYLKRFSATYGFTLMPISLDGGTLPEFPEARYAPTMRTRLDVPVTPAIFLANPSAGEVHPIAYGVISVSELETRIVRLVTMPAGQMTYNVYERGVAQP